MSHASALPLDGPAGDDILVRSQPPLIDAEADSVPAPDAQRPPSKALRILLGASLVLIAANLRPVFFQRVGAFAGNHSGDWHVVRIGGRAYNAARRVPWRFRAFRTAPCTAFWR